MLNLYPCVLLVSLLSISLSFSQNADKSEWAIRTEQLFDFVDSQIELDEFDAALDSLEAVKAWAHRTQVPADQQLATLHHKLGVIHYFLYQYETAQTYLDTAKNLWLQLEGHNSPDLANTYYVISVVYKEQGFLPKAISHLLKALDIRKGTQPVDSLQLADYYHELGDLYNRSLERVKAEEYFREALFLYQNTLGSDALEVADTHTELGILYTLWGRYQTAIDHTQKGLAIYEQSPDPFDQFAAVNCERNIGLAYMDSGVYTLSLNYLERSLGGYRTLQQADDVTEIRLAISGNLDNLGMVYKHLGEYGKAESRTQEALSLLQKDLSPFHPDVARSYDNLGDIYFAQKKWETALEHYHRAILSLVPDFRDEAVTALPSPTHHTIGDYVTLVRALWAKAKCWDKMAIETDDNSQLETALRALQIADTLIAAQQRSFQVDASKYLLLEELFPLYELAIQLSQQLYESTQEDRFLETAFGFSEKSKARILLETRRRLNAAELAAVPDSLIDQLLTLKSAITQSEQQVFEAQQAAETSPEAMQSLQRERFALRNRYEQRLAEIERQYPQYYQLAYEQKSPDLKAIQAQLGSESQMIAYFWGNESLYVFACTQTSMAMHSLQLTDSLIASIRGFRESLRAYQAQPWAAFAEQAHHLYQVLLAPVIKDKHKELIVLPDGPLAYLPFGTFLVQPSTHPGDIDAYLLKHYRLRYDYAAALAFSPAGSSRQSTPPYPFRGYAPKYVFDQGNLGDLPAARNATVQIAEMLKGVADTAAQATKTRFLETASSAGILHLAMHGLVNDRSPLLSSLVFSVEDTADRHLRIADIYGLRLSAAQVVLSACNTAIGDIQRGEGIMSLSRAFAFAGCPSMVASLWSVPSEETAQLMVDYYAGLQQGQTADLAMQAAKMAYIEQSLPERQHPYFWAGWAVVGDVEAVSLRQGLPWGWMGGGAVLLLLIAYVWKSRKGGRKS